MSPPTHFRFVVTHWIITVTNDTRQRFFRALEQPAIAFFCSRTRALELDLRIYINFTGPKKKKKKKGRERKEASESRLARTHFNTVRHACNASRIFVINEAGELKRNFP